MKIIVELPEYLSIGLLLDWNIPMLPKIGDYTDVVSFLSFSYNRTPVTALDDYLDTEEQTLTHTKLKTVGDFLDLLATCLTFKVFDVDVMKGRYEAISPKGVISLYGIYLKISLINEE